MTIKLDADLQKRIVSYQQDELTDHIVYTRLARRVKDAKNRAILQRIAAQEKKHAVIWQKYSGVEASPRHMRAIWYTLLAYILGYAFVIKKMELEEDSTAKEYAAQLGRFPELEAIQAEEEKHEQELQDMLDEERLHYVGAMVLGLNDALVELTGTIAGLTFALANNRLVALAGIITGVSATLSMAASNYLAERADGKSDALKSSMYTGIAYLITVVLLVLPYLLYPFAMYIAALATMLVIVILIIFFFNYYIAIAKSQPFFKRFAEMASISIGVAIISFCIGLAAKYFLQIDL